VILEVFSVVITSKTCRINQPPYAPHEKHPKAQYNRNGKPQVAHDAVEGLPTSNPRTSKRKRHDPSSPSYFLAI
jgi:hypothetical protein